MSAAANWSYTSKATHWARTSRDDWSGVATFAAPVAFDCDYSVEAQTLTDQTGLEFTSRMIIFTERSTIKRGDFVAIGAQSAANPLTLDEAQEVRTAGRYADTFDGRAEDFKVVT